MKIRTKVLCGVVAALLAAPVSAGAAFAQTAVTSPTPQGACSQGPTTRYTDDYDSYTFVQASGKGSQVSGDPGIHLSISKTVTYTVNGSVTVTGTVSATAAVATVSAAVGVQTGTAYSDTTTTGGDWTVPSSYTNGGRLTIGTRVHSGQVSKYQVNASNCTNGAKIGSSATYDLPEQGWYFTKTKI